MMSTQHPYDNGRHSFVDMTAALRLFLHALFCIVSSLQFAWASGPVAAAPQAEVFQVIPESDEMLLLQLRAIEWTAVPASDVLVLSERLAANDRLLAEVLEVLQHAQAEQKYVLSQVLGASQSPRVVAIAMKWADDLGDGDRRANGWLLLRRYQLTPERFRQAIRMLDAEPHAPALEQIIWYVRRAEVPPPSVEALIASKLHRLSRHPNSRVRMASIQTLAEWDRQGRFLMEDLLRLLNDTDPHVRVAAIGASAIYGQLSKPIKRALLRLGTRSDEDPEVRRVALMNLERFSFTQKEFAAYQAAMADVFKASAR